MKPTLLVSHKVVAEFGPRLTGILSSAPRQLEILPFTPGLVNIARGEIVHEAALTDALSKGRLHCAYLDVFTVEPLAPESPLWGLPNVLISPHNAGASTGTYARRVEIFLRNLGCYLGGPALENEVPRV